MFYEYAIYVDSETKKDYVILGEVLDKNQKIFILYLEIINREVYGSQRYIMEKEEFFQKFVKEDDNT